MSVSLRIRNALLNPAWVAFTWLGMVIGVSMIATPMRFAAETITRPVALDVGRVVFAAFKKGEVLALLVLLAVVRFAGSSHVLWAWCAVLTLIVLAQGVWLIPELAARTDLILAGAEPPASPAHAIYASLELAKMAILLFIGGRSLAARS